MTIKQKHSKRIFKSGLAMLLLGGMLGITGFASAPASAAEKVTICHRTNSVTNPYRQISVDLSATHGPDHATHTGLVFDPVVNTSNDPAWGDIIPDVLNWGAAGQAFYEANCQLQNEPPDPLVCEFDPDLDATDEACVPPVCEFDETLAATDEACVPPTDACPDPGNPGIQASASECPIVVTDACPAPGNPGIQASASECPTLVIDNVITPSADPVLVQGVQLAAAPAAPELPRTGKGTLPLAEFGLGLVLMGAGALLFGREQTATV